MVRGITKKNCEFLKLLLILSCSLRRSEWLETDRQTHREERGGGDGKRAEERKIMTGM